MYKPDTILALKEPRTVGTPPVGDPDSEDFVPASEDYEPFPYDRVRVVGQSPINHSDRSSEWVGASGQGVIIEPLTSFGSTIDKPFGELQELYDVESVPEPVQAFIEQPVRILAPEDLPPSPEEVFATVSKEEASKSRRARPERKVRDPFKQQTEEEKAAVEAKKKSIREDG